MNPETPGNRARRPDARLDLDYVLPLRWSAPDPAGLADLTGYLAWLSRRIRVAVVDGSPPEIYAEHDRRWRERCPAVAHLPPDPDLDFGNGKVNGIYTGLRRASGDLIVVADDDVRWSEQALARIPALLADADLVHPQNVFDPMPWHARWDTARTLLNRAFAADWPGTEAVRRSVLIAAGGYDGDTMFDNLELDRTFRAHGGRIRRERGLYVRRRPPTARHFRSQRIRQAYDSLAQPGRLAVELALLPAAALAVAHRRPGLLAAGAAIAVVLAEVGRRREGAAAVFPPDIPLWAPLWLTERAVCSWLAVGQRLCGGVRYRDRRLRVAAHSLRELRRRRAADAASIARSGPRIGLGRRPELPGLVRPVAERLA